MNFNQAKAAMALGLKVTCTGWNPQEIVYMFQHNNRYSLYRYSYERDDYVDMSIPDNWLQTYHNLDTKWEIYCEPKRSTDSSDVRDEST